MIQICLRPYQTRINGNVIESVSLSDRRMSMQPQWDPKSHFHCSVFIWYYPCHCFHLCIVLLLYLEMAMLLYLAIKADIFSCLSFWISPVPYH